MTQRRCHSPVLARCFCRESADVDYSMEIERQSGVSSCVSSYGGEVEMFTSTSYRSQRRKRWPRSLSPSYDVTTSQRTMTGVADSGSGGKSRAESGSAAIPYHLCRLGRALGGRKIREVASWPLLLEFHTSGVEAGDDRLNNSPGIVGVSNCNGSDARFFNRIVVPTWK